MTYLAVYFEDIGIRDSVVTVAGTLMASIGTDNYHTDKKLACSMMSKFEEAGWTVKFNDTFSGALVPLSRYHCDSRVSAIMLEINRKLY